MSPLYETVMRSWAVEALVTSSLLILLVLIIRAPVQRAFGARIAYALWALPGLRMALPRIPGWEQMWTVEFDLPARGVGLLNAAAPSAGEAAMPAIHAASLGPVEALPPLPLHHVSAVAEQPVDWAMVLMAVWLGGAAIHLAWHLAAHRRFMRRALKGSAPLTEQCGIAVLTGPRIAGPLATGLFRRLVLLPHDFTARYAPRERRLVLAHEVAHHVRGDLAANLAGLILLSLHWFNPLAHRAWKAFRQDQELACDETVLADEPADARADYGLAVVKSASPRFPAAACAMHPVGLLKRRLKMMARGPGGIVRRAAGATLGFGLVALGLVATASGSIAQAEPEQPRIRDAELVERDARGVERRISIHNDEIKLNGRTVDARSAEGRRLLASLPKPPVAPVPPRAPVPPAVPAVPEALVPPAPPAPPVPGTRGTYVSLRDGAKPVVIIDGRPVDPDSPEGSAAIRSGRRAAEQGRIAAERGRIAAEQGRLAAEIGRRAAEDAHRMAEQAHREGERARLEGEQARIEAEQARREAMAAGAEARREGARAREEALAEAAQARREARRAGEEARRAGIAARRIAAEAQRSAFASIDAVGIARATASASREDVRRALADARDEVARDRDLDAVTRDRTLRALDARIARLDRAS